jgi:hypothetical protein
MSTQTPPAQGPGRVRLKSDQIRELQGSLVVDHRRRRPLYFDGRFLAARDLVREQNYFLTRQSDLGRAGGFGVVEGLYVQRGGTPTSLTLTAGHGVTPAGELVVLPRDLTLDLTDVPEIQRLNAAFGLLEVPNEAPRNRTGLFVIALRPVEFSANPIASYPTTLTGPRTVEDGEIVEGAVVTLVPYPDEGPDLSASLRRARVAHEIFVGGTVRGEAAGALPLAMVALNRGSVEWLDVFLVRREAGSTQADVVGLGFAPRGLREAHLLQYEAHLREVLALRRSLGYRFAASEYFHALPPAGRLPAAAINPTDFTQVFFPPTVEVDLSIVPEDEIPALVEESLSLAPIDLTRTPDELDSTAVLVIVPLPRSELRTMSSSVSSFSRSLKPAAPGMLAKRTPLEHLRGLRLPGNFVPLPAPAEAEDDAWRRLLARGGMLWYLRRRSIHRKADLEGERALLKALQAPASSSAELNQLQIELKAKEEQQKSTDRALQTRETQAVQREKELAARETALEQQLRSRGDALAKREGELERREGEIRKLEGEVTRRDAELRRLESTGGEREAELRRREADLVALQAKLQAQENELAGRALTLETRRRELDNLASVLQNRDTAITQREHAVGSRESAAGTREAAIASRLREQEAKQRELDGRESAIRTREGQLTQRARELNDLADDLRREAAVERLPAFKRDQINRRFEP